MMTDERPTQSDRRKLVQAHFDRLGLGDVGAWISAHRDNSRPRSEFMSYSQISKEIWFRTNMDVSYETLRRWHLDDGEAAAHADDT